MSEKLASIKRACAITDRIFSLVVGNFSKFETEKDIERFILNQIKKFKVTTAFPPIIASGSNAANPHHKPTSNGLKVGFCVIDMGVRVRGYCSDMTRTVYIGIPDEKERRIYNLVLNLQKKSLNEIKIGKEYKKIDNFVRSGLGSLKKKFIHSLGHGVGKWIHMKPRIGPKSMDSVKKGEIITIEPGVYVKKRYGIRIEDTILVKNKCVEILSKSSKRLISISKIN